MSASQSTNPKEHIGLLGDLRQPHIVTRLYSLRDELEPVAERVARERGGRFKAVMNLRGFDQDDIDLLITDQVPLRVIRDGVDNTPGGDLVLPQVRVIAFYGPTERPPRADVAEALRETARVLGSNRVDTSGNFGVHLRQPRANVQALQRSASQDLTGLAIDTLLPVLQSHSRTNPLPVLRCVGKMEHWVPLVVDRDGSVLVAKYRRPITHGDRTWYGGECLLVPAWTSAPERWVQWMIDEWANEGIAVFQLDHDWTSDPRWQTTEELAATSLLHEARDAERRAHEQHRLQVAEAQGALDRAAAAAHGGARRLLECDGDQLVDAVVDALRALGFDVAKSDQPGDPHPNEDLLVRHPDAPDWVAVTEVKGTTKGAKRDFLEQLANHVIEYVHREHRKPDARWLIVNHFRALSPSRRPELYAAERPRITAFGANEDGLVINTCLLFHLIQDQQPGDAQWLMNLRGLAPQQRPTE